MVLVRVHRISSFTDPETGAAGKQIEFVEVRRRSALRPAYGLSQEDSALLMGIFGQLQNLGILPPFRELVVPKMVLYLTEDEYDMLGIQLEVNDVYELEFKDGRISLRKATEEGLSSSAERR